MNLKEAFRYQRFLDSLMNQASAAITKRDNCVHTTETHLLSKLSFGEEDRVVEQEPTDYIGNDAMLQFALELVKERGELSLAIDETKERISLDLDAAVELNKFRQRLAASIGAALASKTGKTIGPAIGHRLNVVSGSLERYQYEVEYVASDAFDRESFAEARRQLLRDAEQTSAEIDLAIVTSEVSYVPPFDVNSSFDECVEIWKRQHAAA